MAETNNIPQVADKGKVVYLAGGQEVKLSYNLVRDTLTRGNGQVTDQELTNFISLCKFNQINPFLGEAYLVKFGTQPASLITSREFYMKRADACLNYEGIESGVIVIMEDTVAELEGGFVPPRAQLVGAWCKVHRSDRKYPVLVKVNLSEYDKKQSIWNEKKSSMIIKVAEAQALRKAFPTNLGSMYLQEEVTESEAQVLETTLNNVNANNAAAQQAEEQPQAPSTEQPPHAPSAAAEEPKLDF